MRRHLLIATTLIAGLLTGGSTAQASSPGWTGLSPCTQPELAAYLCGELTVRLDRDDRRSKTLDLPVLVGGNPQAKRTMLMLTGGPGQPGPVLAPRVLQAFEGIKNDYRIVMLDQRGTGANALNCPELQSERGGSDLRVPSKAAVLACAAVLAADREHYATTDSVADFEDLRRALKVDRWAVNGVSYGTYTAQRYAAAHRSQSHPPSARLHSAGRFLPGRPSRDLQRVCASTTRCLRRSRPQLSR